LARLVEDVLETWRAAERLLEDLPAVDPDHETVALAIEQLRALYQQLTAHRAVSESSLAASHRAVERSQELIARVRGKLEARRDAGASRAAPREPGLEGEPAGS
jgi:hypothetical protein